MKAIISGQASAALVETQQGTLFVPLDGEPRQVGFDEQNLFNDVGDLQVKYFDSIRDVRDSIEVAWASDRGLLLSLFCLDSSHSAEARLTYVEALDELLSISEVENTVLNRFLSRPLPSDCDLSAAIDLIKKTTVEHRRVCAVLEKIESFQTVIGESQDAWESVPEGIWGTSNKKAEFFYKLVEDGVFRMFVEGLIDPERLLFDLLSHPEYRGLAISRTVFQKWLEPFRGGNTYRNLTPAAEISDNATSSSRHEKRMDRVGRSVLERINKQKNTIKQLLGQGDEERAWAYINELIREQQRNSTAEQRAMSLCDLSQFAKSIDAQVLRLQLAELAVRTAPSDVYSYITAGFAALDQGQFQKAMDYFSSAKMYGDDHIAPVGRAEVFKAIGRFDDALSIYDQCSKLFPDDRFISNGRVAILTAAGRLSEALEASERVIEGMAVEIDPVALCNHAQILRDQGQVQNSLKEIEDLLRLFPNEYVPLHMKGELLRERGRFEEARKHFDFLIKRFPLSPSSLTGKAKVLRDAGDLKQAIETYALATRVHPMSPAGFLGLAEAHKKIGDYERALSLYGELESHFERPLIAQTGIASIYVLQGKFDKALQLLPSNHPATIGDWVAFHIRCMAYLKRGDFATAREGIELGIRDNPWKQQIPLFHAALASLDLKEGRINEALSLLNNMPPGPLVNVSNAIFAHAKIALGQRTEARNALRKLKNVQDVKLRDVGRALSLCVDTGIIATPMKESLFSGECDLVLLAA